MTEAATKFMPIFVGLFLTLRGLFWIVEYRFNKQRKETMSKYKALWEYVQKSGKISMKEQIVCFIQ